MNTQLLFSLCLGTLAVIGCNGNVLDVPSESQGGAPSTGEVVSAGNPLVYSGFIESRAFGVPSVPLRIAFTKMTDDTFEGTVTYGDEKEPIPVMDPSKGYPEGKDVGSSWSGAQFEGYPYPIVRAMREGKRLLFSTDIAGPFEPWCIAQTSYLQGDGESYKCSPRTDGALMCPQDDAYCYAAKEGEPPLAVDLAHFQMCVSEVCLCDAEKCGRGTFRGQEFDLRFDDDELSGGDVYLTRE